MTERIFDRQVIVSLDDVEYTDFRIDFDVTKTLGSEANEATIELYNVPFDDGAVKRAQRRETLIRLFAGYDAPALIFQGNPIKGGVSYERNEADVVLKMEAKDGYRQYKDTRLNVSFETGTSFADIAETIAEQMGVPVGTIDVPERKSLTQGVVLTGGPETVLRRLAETIDGHASVQDGRLQILPKSRTNSNSGPRYATELGNLITYSDTDDGIKLTVLLDATLNPGDRFQMDHPEQSGVFKARKITYSGSKWSDDFYCEIEAVASPGEA